jgi:S-adenosylmethionine synthetase
MQLIIGDRATFRFRGKEIPVDEIAVSTAKQWFKNNLRFVDPEEDIRYTMVLAEGSDELTDLFLRPGELRGGNEKAHRRMGGP